MRMVLGLGSIVWGALALAGCAAAASGEPSLSAVAQSGSLAAPVAVAMGQPVDAQVTFTIAGGFDSARPETLTVARPVLRVHVDAGRAMLDELRLPLGDVDIPAEALPPHGLGLRDLTLSAQPTSAEVVQASADALELRASLPLALDWSMQLYDGALYRLGTVRTAPLTLDVRVARVAGQVTAMVDARCDGTCWAINGVARLSDGAVHLVADADVTATP